MKAIQTMNAIEAIAAEQGVTLNCCGGTFGETVAYVDSAGHRMTQGVANALMELYDGVEVSYDGPNEIIKVEVKP